MDTLYVETNFLIGISTGRNSAATSLLENPSLPVQLVVPGVCFLEALGWMEGEFKRREGLRNQWNVQIGELKRDLTSPFARNLRAHLDQAIVENDGLLQDVGDRLFKSISLLSDRAQILNVSPTILKASISSALIPELTDNLIVHTILDHARSSPGQRRALFTENATTSTSRKSKTPCVLRA